MRIDGVKGDPFQPKGPDEALTNLKNDFAALQKLTKKNEPEKFKKDFDAFINNLNQMLESKSLSKHQKEVLTELKNSLSQAQNYTDYTLPFAQGNMKNQLGQNVIEDFFNL